MNEPTRKSYLDLVRANLAAAERTQFITRLVYFGSYHGNDEYLQKKFESIVHYLRSEYAGVSITGLLLVYPQYFLHVIETSEELIFRHFRLMFHDDDRRIDLGRVLPLPPHHHVHRRFFPRWLKLSTRPPRLLEKLSDTSARGIEKQLANCLAKVYALCEYIYDNSRGSQRAGEETLKNLRDLEQRHLPESDYMEFFVNSKSPILRDVREYVAVYEIHPSIRLYNDFIWPPSCDFMPRDVFVEQTSRRDSMLRRFSQHQQWQRQTE